MNDPITTLGAIIIIALLLLFTVGAWMVGVAQIIEWIFT